MASSGSLFCNRKPSISMLDFWSCFVVVVAWVLPASVAAGALYNVTIETQYGYVKGIPAFSSAPAGNISNWQDITVWKGIPFAADTSGQNRWRAPQPRAAWNQTLLANAFGPACPGSVSGANYTFSEDCLSLNIWNGATSTTDKRPVILWSHPAQSSGGDSLFDGGGMASKGMVFATYNYRDSSFGWLAHPELSQEQFALIGKNVSGNWGTMDQFAALKWVYDNIAAFGGDPEQITIAGQSAGSAATYHMVNSPLTKGQFKHAIVESGARDPFDPLAATLAEGYTTLAVSLAQGVNYTHSKNVTNIAQMRELPTETLTEGFMSEWRFGATLDYYILPDTYFNILLNGPPNDVPLITGNTKDESGAGTDTNLTVAEYEADLQTQYGSTYALKFLELYPAANSTAADMAYNTHYRDTSRVSSWLFANSWQRSAQSPIYSYYWDHAPPGQNRGAYHESEICYVLNNLYGTDLPFVAEDYAIAEKMSAYWVNFAMHGDPNVGDAYTGSTDDFTYWSTSTPTRNVTMHVGDGWGDVPIASPAQVQLILDFFHTQTPF